jgi:hypothetical protein
LEEEAAAAEGQSQSDGVATRCVVASLEQGAEEAWLRMPPLPCDTNEFMSMHD